MDVFNLLSYINKISLFAFFITTLVVAYQIYVLKKEKTKEQTPSIPDFKEKNNLNEVANFTSLPSYLTKKDLKKVNYSKLVFLIISLLTVMVVIFVVFLIRQNNSSRNQASISPTIVVLPTSTLKPKTPTKAPTVRPIAALSPSQTPTPSPSPTTALISPSPAFFSSLSPAVALSTSPTNPSPTEIILAQAPSLTPTTNLTNGQNITNSAPTVLPETGIIGKGLLIIGVAISAIFFSFWF
ncbi:MAG: hypothetical protein WC894_00200 [Patescibacteria group bacterium]